MANLLDDDAFRATVAATRAAIRELAAADVPDAIALRDRGQGRNNLQAHYNSIVPLAVAFARANPDILDTIRNATRLTQNMGAASREARNREMWDDVANALRRMLRARGNDIVAQQMRTRRPQSCTDVATTYLSTYYGGGHATGGAGDTVLKRTLKILSHLFAE